MNQILFEEEKEGGAPRGQREMHEFREALDDCRLKDLGFFGKLFTWWNKQSKQYVVFERLDRAVENTEWLKLMPYIGVIHMERDKSDHVPINVTNIPRSENARSRKRAYRFEDMWLRSPECENVVKEAWSNSMRLLNAEDVLVKIKSCSMTLQNGARGNSAMWLRKLRMPGREWPK